MVATSARQARSACESAAPQSVGATAREERARPRGAFREIRVDFQWLTDLRGFIQYGATALCNSCATAYELARLRHAAGAGDAFIGAEPATDPACCTTGEANV